MLCNCSCFWLFLCLFFWNIPLHILLIFKLNYFGVLMLLSWVPCRFCLLASCQMYKFQIFSPIQEGLCLLLSLPGSSSVVWWNTVCIFWLLISGLLGFDPKSSWIFEILRSVLSVHSSSSFMVSSLIFSSLIHLRLTFWSMAIPPWTRPISSDLKGWPFVFDER